MLSIPRRLYHLDQINCPNKGDIRLQLYKEVLTTLRRIPCRGLDQGDEPSASTSASITLALEQNDVPVRMTTKMLQGCHIYRDLKRLFAAEHEAIFSAPKEEKQSTLQRTIVAMSFSSNIVLLVLKIVALAISHSLSILASTMDSAMDILSGLVLFLAHRKAKKGIRQGEYQRVLHR